MTAVDAEAYIATCPSVVAAGLNLRGAEWRLTWPLEALKRRGCPVDLMTAADIAEVETWLRPDAALPPLVMISGQVMPGGAAHPQWVAALHEAGINIVGDVSDLFDGEWVAEMQATWPEMIEWTIAAGVTTPADVAAVVAGERAAEYARAMADWDGAIVSTERMATVARQHLWPGAPVVVVPNAIASAGYLAARAEGAGNREVPPLTVGWVGSARLPADFVETGLRDAWTAIARRYPNVTFVTLGKLPPEVSRAIPAARWVSYGPQRFDLYPYFLTEIDIAVCPLADRPFNLAKSPQKVWEHALTGAAVVASPTLYADDPGFAANGGLLADGADAWEAHLSRLIENELERRSRVETLQKFVLEERSLAANIWRWPAAWTEIVAAARTSSIPQARRRTLIQDRRPGAGSGRRGQRKRKR